MEKRKIYVLFCCDVWKSYSSMRLCGATTSKKMLERMVITAIRKKEMFCDDRDKPVNMQIHKFRNDFNTKPLSDINDLLIFGQCECVENGVYY